VADDDAVDMSPDAIDRRLREVGQLFKLGVALRDARWLGPVEAPAASSGGEAGSRRPGTGRTRLHSDPGRGRGDRD
jgi:hypothetical protein